VRITNLLERLKKVESDLTANRRWNCSLEALNWLNNHHNRTKKGLGFVTKRVIYLVNRKYVGLPENIVCFHCDKKGYYHYTCSLRKYAMEKNLIYVKHIWVRKDEICMPKGMEPKWI